MAKFDILHSVWENKNSASILARFEGMPQFEWMDDFVNRFKSSLKLTTSNEPIVGFEKLASAVQHYEYKIASKTLKQTENLGNGLISKLCNELDVQYSKFENTEQCYLTMDELTKLMNKQLTLNQYRRCSDTAASKPRRYTPKSSTTNLPRI